MTLPSTTKLFWTKLKIRPLEEYAKRDLEKMNKEAEKELKEWHAFRLTVLKELRLRNKNK